MSTRDNRLRASLMRYAGGTFGVVVQGRESDDPVMGWEPLSTEAQAREVEALVRLAPTLSAENEAFKGALQDAALFIAEMSHAPHTRRENAKRLDDYAASLLRLLAKVTP